MSNHENEKANNENLLYDGQQNPQFQHPEEGSQAVVEAAYAFNKPGTYFPVLRAASEREGKSSDLYTQVLNLCRVRVVVQ